MFESLTIVTASRLARSLGGQVAMSVAVSLGVAGVLAVPGLLFPRDKAAPVAVAQMEKPQASAAQPSTWLSPVDADGKIGDRHRATAADDAQPLRVGLVSPAALVMPLSTGWPQPVFAEPARVAAILPEKAARVTVAEILPVRRPAVLAERLKPAASAAPLATAVLPPASAVDPVEARPEPTLLGRVVSVPVERATTIVSSAAGMVGSAGSWTVAQATSLLPRW